MMHQRVFGGRFPGGTVVKDLPVNATAAQDDPLEVVQPLSRV